MKESEAWAVLRVALQSEACRRGSGIHLVRIESSVGVGIFDTCVCYHGVTVWLEGKYLTSLPKRQSTLVKVGLSLEQEAFAIRRYYAGGQSFVWCRVGTVGWVLLNLCSLDLIRGARAGLPQDYALGVGRYYRDARSLSSGFLDELELIGGVRGVNDKKL